MILQLYLAFIHLLLEYAIAVWNSISRDSYEINSTESVQKIMMCSKSWNADYDSLLLLCSLPTLAISRNCMNLCF